MVKELPPYRAVLAVDVKDFSGIPAVDHRAVIEEIPTVLGRAFERAGHAEVWAGRRFPGSEGDGFVVGFRPEVLPVLVGPVVDALQEELAYLRRLRMRMSIAVGPLNDSDEGRFSDGSGPAMIETHRLLDAEPVRRLLAASDPAVTLLAVVVSPRVYEDVVLTGYTDKRPAEFTPVPVAVKSYQGKAFLHVPKPSGELLRHGLDPGGRPEPAGTHPAGGGGVVNTVTGSVTGRLVQARDIHLGPGGI